LQLAQKYVIRKSLVEKEIEKLKAELSKYKKGSGIQND
jgi:uncharacterized small protein (DUF1192 family)